MRITELFLPILFFEGGGGLLDVYIRNGPNVGGGRVGNIAKYHFIKASIYHRGTVWSIFPLGQVICKQRECGCDN